MIKKPKILGLMKGPKLNLSTGLGNEGLAGGLPNIPRAPIMIRSYGDFRKIHFTPLPGTRIRIG